MRGHVSRSADRSDLFCLFALFCPLFYLASPDADAHSFSFANPSFLWHFFCPFFGPFMSLPILLLVLFSLAHFFCPLFFLSTRTPMPSVYPEGNCPSHSTCLANQASHAELYASTVASTERSTPSFSLPRPGGTLLTATLHGLLIRLSLRILPCGLSRTHSRPVLSCQLLLPGK